MTRQWMLPLTAIAASAALMSGCVTRETRVVEVPRAAPAVIVAQPVAMPPAQVRAMPGPIVEDRGAAPAAGMSWLPGHWRYDNTRWVWQPGRWVTHAVPPMPAAQVESMGNAPSTAHYWVPGYWGWNGTTNTWQWVNGGWRS